MARVVYSRNALANLERAFSSLDALAPDAAVAAVAAIRSAIEVFEHQPLIGHVVDGDLRELVISFWPERRSRALPLRPARHEVRILAIRHQRELDDP